MSKLRIVGASFGLFLLLICLSPGWLVSQDASARLVIARRLWQHQTVFATPPRPERFVETPRGLTTYFGIGQTLSFIPFDILGVGLAKLFPADTPHLTQVELLPLIFLYGPLVGLLWYLGLLRLFKQLDVSQKSAQALAITLLFSTTLLHYFSQSLQEEAILCMILTWLLSAIFSSAHFQFGFLAMTCILFRYNSIFALFACSFLWFEQLFKLREPLFKSLSLVLKGVSLPLVTLLLFNYWRWGSLFETGYHLHYEQLLAQGIQTWRSVQPQIAWALLFGTGKGLFILSPLLLLGLVGILIQFRRHRLYFISLIIALAASVLFHSKLNGFSCGGHSWGGRFQVHFIPLLCIPLLYGIQSFAKSLIGKIEIALLIFVGLSFQFASVWAPESLEYGQEMIRLGDYREALILSSTQGQLPLRLRSLSRWVKNKPLEYADKNPALQKLVQHHIPNVWGYSYRSYYQTGGSGYLISIVWWAFFCISILIIGSNLRLAFSMFDFRRDCEDYEVSHCNASP